MSGLDPARAELLTPEELDTKLAQQSVAYVPLGTLEFHGPHLPIGLDALTAHGVCTAAAAHSGGIVLPPVYQGFGGGHGHYPWTIMMGNGDGIATHLKATLTRLEEFGVRRAVIFSGHFAPEQLEMIDAVASEWNGEGRSQLTASATAVNRCESAPLSPDHAGAFESTLLAGISPELVHVDRLPDANEHPGDDPGGDPFGEHRHDQEHPLWGVFGPDPRLADMSRGPDLLEHLARWLADIATE